MSDVVKNIVSAIETRIAAVIGTTHKKMDYVYDITKNSLNRDYNRYGVIPMGLTNDTGVTRAMTVDQDFEIIFINRFVNKQGDDVKQRDAVNDLFKQFYLVINDLYATKLGIPETVMTVNRVTINDPEFTDEDNTANIRIRINVKYRQLLT